MKVKVAEGVLGIEQFHPLLRIEALRLLAQACAALAALRSAVHCAACEAAGRVRRRRQPQRATCAAGVALALDFDGVLRGEQVGCCAGAARGGEAEGASRGIGAGAG